MKTYADHEVITPPHALRKAVALAGETADDSVARAEAALAQLSSEFAGWMDAECERLEAARQEVKRLGLSKQTHVLLFRAAHDIKGDAATFGYPSAAAAAESLCRIIEHAPDLAKVPVELIKHHINAIQAIVRDHTKLDTAATAGELSRKLRGVADEYLIRVNRDRPEHLEAVLGPSLVPEMEGDKSA